MAGPVADVPLQSGYGLWPALIKPFIYSRVDLFLISNTSGLCMKKKITVGAYIYIYIVWGVALTAAASARDF